MRPLSSPAGCDGCARLSQKIIELEGRISVLYQIKDDEDLLDSLLTTTQPISTRLDGSLHQTAATAVRDRWPQLGAKPKAREVCCSTLHQSEPWSVAGGGLRWGAGLPLHLSAGISRTAKPLPTYPGHQALHLHMATLLSSFTASKSTAGPLIPRTRTLPGRHRWLLRNEPVHPCLSLDQPATVLHPRS
ncbi:hypothetical protein AOLI_G00300150 [Acnodon oligacanthus]